MPADKHGDTPPENVEPRSLLLHQAAAPPSERLTSVRHVSITEASVTTLFLHFTIIDCLVEPVEEGGGDLYNFDDDVHID
ncbi:hypothetical protein V6N11_055421 [Hibiscus sabdariffa]|uniref:Uncharacterized protein n=1 Tax=Hibiscus sabdariffa TaxID=183260 RepID=A0ABR2PFN6_9ROSI